MRLAEHGHAWRSVPVALVGVGIAAGIGIASGAIGLRCTQSASRQTAAPTSIHIKYRAGQVRSAAIAGQQPRPLFTSTVQARVAAFDDPRARWVRVEVARMDVDGVLAELRSDRAVETAFVPPVPELPTMETPFAGDASCPITTPSFESYQGYLGPAPHGIDAPAAWRRGARGQGVWFADVEGAWNAAHEDVPGARMVHVGGEMIDSPLYRMHGTAVVGEVVGLDNGRGVVGIAPDVERVVTSSIGGISAAEAIDAAAEELRAGDVLLIELHSPGPRGRYLPMEYWDDCFDAIEAATSRGVIVIEAGGNGAENLDHRAYGGKLQRSGRDSGAILVGAGGPPRKGFHDRERLDFSNYGSRVDVQGWGRMVATLDYGDLQSCDATGERHYTGEFSGTSSASPIVAGAAILVQSVAKTSGRVLSPLEVRDLLRATGTPQTGNVRESIGPRPDLARALDKLDRRGL